MAERTKPLEEQVLDIERAKARARRIVEAENAPPIPPLVCLTIPELFAQPTTDYLVDGLLPEGALAELVGDSESLKSFFAVHLGLTIATKQKAFFGQTIVKHGPVIYIAAEGAGAFQFRVRAWGIEHDVDLREIPFRTIPVPVNLRDATFQATFRQLAESIHPVLVIVDTLHRCIPGAEESTSRDIGEVVAFAQQMQYDFRTAVLFLHHPPKNDPKGRGRGSGALYYAADTEISAAIRREAELDGTKVVDFVVVKQKDDQKISFCLTNRIVTVTNELGGQLCYRSGRPIRTCVLVEATGEDLKHTSKTLAREREIIAWVAANPGRYRTAVLNAIGGKEKETGKLIDKLLEQGDLRDQEKGKGRFVLFVAGDADAVDPDM